MIARKDELVAFSPLLRDDEVAHLLQKRLFLFKEQLDDRQVHLAEGLDLLGLRARQVLVVACVVVRVQDVDAAVAWMEAAAEESLGQELSGYMEYSDITPLPREAFTLDADGITFWYPSDQLRLMSGYSGACQFFYSELAPFLLTEEDAVPAQIGAVQAPLSQQEARKAIEAAVTEGKLPHVPVTLGDRMTDVVDRYRLLRTPDEFPGGRYYVLEDPAFREILVISDAIQSGYGASVVEGVQMRRGDLCGLLIGQAVREDWHAILGEPDETMTFTDSMAYDYGLPVGESDIYHFGEHELRLHADTDGVLRAVQLGK